MLHKKNRFRPLYKQFLKLRENVQNRKKILKFKLKKWEKLILFYQRKLKRYRKFKPKDQTKYSVPRFSNRGNSYKRRYKATLNRAQKFRLFYGGLSKKLLKTQIKLITRKKSYKKITNFYLALLEKFEYRLDTILYRAKFSISLRNARQLIVHGKVLVNNKLIRIPSYRLKPSDIISIKPTFNKLIIENIERAEIWPIVPKYLSINYKTMQIIINDHFKHTNLSTNFSFHLKLEKILTNYYRH